MAFTSNSNLNLDPTNRLNHGQVVLRDQQHAARVFSDQQFRLAPKHSFLFHVAFNINPAAVKNTNIIQRYGQEINMLVKSIDLPGYSVKTETLNQYNRKKVVQYGHEINEIGIKFHDDNMSLINQLWQNYYSYYYADSTSAQKSGAYNRVATRNSNFITTPYGFDNRSGTPFFNYIMIYQMARHEYVSYKLINPVIKSFTHNKLDYSQTGVKDFDMKILYEAVSYGSGLVSDGSVEGFASSHYDKSPSPLKGPNPDPAVTMPSFATAIDTTALAPGILQNAIQTSQTYQSTQNASTGGGGGSGIMNTLGAIGLGVAAFGIGSKVLNSLGGVSGIASSVSGFVDKIFPGSGTDSTESQAAQPSDLDPTTASDTTTSDDGSSTEVADDGSTTTVGTDTSSDSNIADSGAGTGTASDLADWYG